MSKYKTKARNALKYTSHFGVIQALMDGTKLIFIENLFLSKQEFFFQVQYNPNGL